MIWALFICILTNIEMSQNITKNYLHLLVSNICEVGTICRLGGVLWVNVEVL